VNRTILWQPVSADRLRISAENDLQPARHAFLT
jgi:hypothetical protein